MRAVLMCRMGKALIHGTDQLPDVDRLLEELFDSISIAWVSVMRSLNPVHRKSGYPVAMP